MLKLNIGQYYQSQGIKDLNTSHVKVKLASYSGTDSLFKNLNTSHVKVKLWSIILLAYLYRI